jgi:hypothetical protein
MSSIKNTLVIFLTVRALFITKLRGFIPTAFWTIKSQSNPVKHEKIFYSNVCSTTRFGLVGQQQVDQKYKNKYIALMETEISNS